MQITKIIQKKNPLTLEELKSLMDKMVEARNIMSESKEQLDALKDAHKDLCEQQNGIIDKCFEDYARGFSVSNIDCTVSYDGKVATYYDVKTGGLVEGLPLEDGEQLEMTGGKVRDAETIIRQANEEESDNE